MAPIFSEEGKNAAPIDTNALPYISDSLEVPVFIPPASPVEKKVPVMRVDAAITLRADNSRTLTLIRGEASTLPDIPIPPKPEPRKPRILTPEEAARLAAERRHSLKLGATIYDHRTSLVHWQHPDTGESYEAICGFDLGLLEGIGEFTHDGENYQIMLGHSYDVISDQQRTGSHALPDFAKVSAGSITILKGNPKDSTGTAPITLLKDLIATEKSRLVAYQAARRNYQQAAAEWEKAHPPVQRDETYWLKPHRGSRYLSNPIPESTIK